METLLLSLALMVSQLQAQVDELQVKNEAQSIINYIMECESRGDTTQVNYEDAKITGYPSYGLFQFQPYTFLSFAKKYKVLPEDAKPSMKELVRLMKIPIYNNAVAHGMIKDGFAEQHWKNCYNKYKNSLAVKFFHSSVVP